MNEKSLYFEEKPLSIFILLGGLCVHVCVCVCVCVYVCFVVVVVVVFWGEGRCCKHLLMQAF